MLRLIVTTKEDSRIVETAEPVVTVGRGSHNAVRISDDGASREHCRIRLNPDGSYTLIDLASRNGTKLNGEPTDEHALTSGDTICTGTTTISVEILGSKREGAAAPLAQPEAAAAPPGAVGLFVLTGPNKGHVYPLTGRITTIGRRRRDCDIAVFDKGVSNRHAEIRRGPDGLVLVDCGSRNGTFLNNERTQRSPLKPGDRILVGKTLMEVRGIVPTVAVEAPPTVAVETAPSDDETTDVGPAEPAPAEAPAGRRTPLLLVGVVLGVVALAGILFFSGALRRWLSSSGKKAPGEGAGNGVTSRPTTSDAAAGPLAPGDAGVLTGTEASRFAADLAAAERLATQKRTGAAILRFEEIATRYASFPAEAKRARRRALDLGAEAKAQLEAALRQLRRATLTGEPSDFDAARDALAALGVPLKHTSHEQALAEALERVETERGAAQRQRHDAQAAALLAAAKEHSYRKESHIARLHCRELLARFPDAPAAADAKALLKTLEAPAAVPQSPK